MSVTAAIGKGLVAFLIGVVLALGLFFLYFMQCNCKVIVFDKIAPMAIFFTAACIKIMILDLAPNCFDLLANYVDVPLCNKNLFFFVGLFFVRLDKIKFGAHDPPSLFLIVFNEDLIKHGLPPVITPHRILV